MSLKDKFTQFKDKATEKIESIDKEAIKEKFNLAKEKIEEVKPKNIEEAFELSKDIIEEGGNLAINALKNKPIHEKVLSSLNSNATKLSGAIGAFMADTEILKHLGKLTESAATVYDKALDSEYLQGISGGGGNHRLFDNGHDIFSAWDKAKDALPDDTFSEEVIGYTSALWKDITTVKGLPFTTISKDTYDSIAETICGHIPGLDKKYLYDLLSFDAMEILSTALGAVSVVFALKREDQEKLAEILGSMGIISILSANPIMGVFVISTSAFAYQKKKMEFDKEAFTKSAIVTSSSMALFSILGMPILAELIIVGVATKLLRTKVLDNQELSNFMKNKIKDKVNQFSTEEIKIFLYQYNDKKSA